MSKALGSDNIRLVRRLLDVVSGLDDEQYARRPVGPYDFSVGGHVRHLYAHYRVLLGGLAVPLLAASAVGAGNLLPNAAGGSA